MIREKLCALIIGLIVLSGCQSEQYQQVNADANLFIVVNLIESSLSFFDNSTREEVAKWEMPYSFTGAMMLPDQEHILLYGKHLGNIYLYNITTGKRLDVWNTGQGIVNAVLSKDETKLFLADQENNSIRMMSLEGEAIAEINVGQDPLTIMENEQGDLLYVVNFEDPRIHVINVEKQEVVQIFNGKIATVGAALLDITNELWTGGHGSGDKIGNTISIYSLTNGNLVEEIPAPIMPVDFARIGQYVYVISHGSNQLRKIDAETREVIDVIEIGANPFEIEISNNLIYSASYDSDEIVIVDPKQMKKVDTVKTGRGPFQVLFKRGVGHE